MTADTALEHAQAVAACRAELLLSRGEVSLDEPGEVKDAMLILVAQRYNALVASVRGVSHGFLRVGPPTPAKPREPKPALLLTSEEG